MTRAVTVFYAEACLKEMTLTYACAGHEQPLYWKGPDTEADLLKADGIMIGAWAEAEFEEKSLSIASGSWLLMYTDGLCYSPKIGQYP
jgi:sigma-B regulation protein RsbU (phosphoserine phosphatase)